MLSGIERGAEGGHPAAGLHACPCPMRMQNTALHCGCDGMIALDLEIGERCVGGEVEGQCPGVDL